MLVAQTQAVTMKAPSTLPYLAIMMPMLAAQTQAATMKAPCRTMYRRGFAAINPTCPRPSGTPDTVLKHKKIIN